jgi:polysaccharide export outer membrane protein
MTSHRLDALAVRLRGGAAALVQAGVLALALGAGLAPLAALAQPAAASPASPAAAEYRLGSGDVIRINVYQNPDLTIETRVTEAGIVSYPLLGAIRLGGLSVTSAEQLIANGLRGGNFVKSPQVTLVVLQVRGNQASVLGQVNRPGRYPLEVADMRLTDLLAMAGGTATSGADLVIVSGMRNGKPFRQEIDVPTVFAPGGKDKDILILNGDAVWVDRQPLVYIYGEVQRPGSMRLERGMTLMQTLATGGGLTQRGTQKGIRVHRKDDDGKVQVITPTLDDAMRDGDVVYVRESLF